MRSPRYHQALPPAPGLDAGRDDAASSRRAMRNPRCDAGLPAAAVRGMARSRDWRELDGDRGMARASVRRDGFVRRAHGDLHLGNLCLWQGRPVPFDALEFDEAMATIDLGYDLAFLLMDLDHRVGRARGEPGAEPLRRAHRRRGDLTRGCPLFLSLRAMVRAHVEAKRGATRRCAGLSARGRGAICSRAAGAGVRWAACRAPAKPRWRARWRRSWAARPARWCCAATRSASAGTASRRSSGCRRAGL